MRGTPQVFDEAQFEQMMGILDGVFPASVSGVPKRNGGGAAGGRYVIFLYSS